MQKKILLDFGIPEHGWLPTALKSENLELELEISDVPIDPMYLLCNSLIQICKDIKSPERVMWNLEPFCYFLQFESIDGNYKVVISESINSNSPTKITKEITGDFEEIILPFYRGLKKFVSASYKAPHWPVLMDKLYRIEELTTLIKERKNNNL